MKVFSVASFCVFSFLPRLGMFFIITVSERPQAIQQKVSSVQTLRVKKTKSQS
jgi:hypothetical protein